MPARLVRLAWVLIGMLGLGAASPARAQEAAREQFVRARGASFVIGDSPFRFVGANAAVMHGKLDRERHEATLDAVAADGANVVRVWAFGEAPADAPEWWDDYAFRRGDAWIESSFEHLDRVLVAARARGLRVIVVLGNRWADYGGAPEIARRCGRPPTERDFTATSLDAFFRCVPCRVDYRAHVERIVSRVNGASGVAYRDDPTIFAYELMNEASAFDASAGDALVEWIDHMSRAIRALDPNHMIAAGHIGYRTRAERRVWARAQSVEHVSYADAHMYPESDPRIDGAPMLMRAIRDRVSLAHDVVRKPIVIGEFGFARAWKGRQRPRAFDAFLSQSLAAGVDGVLAWIYQPWPGQEREHGVYVDGPRAADSERTRRVLRAAARRASGESAVAVSEPALRSLDDEPLYRASTRMLRMPPARARWKREREQASLTLGGRQYIELSAESFGDARHAEHPHLWLSGESELRYFVPDPPLRDVSSLTVSLHVSAELPGVDDEPGAGRTSVLELRLDDVRLGEIVAPIDDGRGARVELTIREPEALRRLTRPGGHRLDVRARDPQRSRGMSVYGDVELRASP